MKKLLPALALLGVFFAPGFVSAAYNPLLVTINAGTSQLSGWDTQYNADALGLTSVGATALYQFPPTQIYKGTYPDFSHPYSTSSSATSLGPRTLASFNNAVNTEGLTMGAGDYFFLLKTSSSTNVGVVCYTTPNGTSGWATTTCSASQPSPEIYDIAYSTSTGIATVTGYIVAPVGDVRYEVSLEQLGGAFGSLPTEYTADGFTFVTATTTGTFSYSFNFFWPEASESQAVASTSLVVGRDYSLTALITRYDAATNVRTEADSRTESLTYGGIVFDPGDPYGYFDAPYSVCSFAELGGCVRNVIVWSLVPNPVAVANFKASILDQLWHKRPFSDVLQVKEVYDTIWTTSPTALTSAGLATSTISVNTAIGRITFISDAQISAVPFSDDVWTILKYLIWFGFLSYLWVRITTLLGNPVPEGAFRA